MMVILALLCIGVLAFAYAEWLRKENNIGGCTNLFFWAMAFFTFLAILTLATLLESGT